MNKKQRAGTIKFSVSMPAADFKEIESARRRAGRSRSQYLREAVLNARGPITRESGPGAVREDRAAYVTADMAVMTDAAEQRKRAIAAAGVFASGLGDLSTAHDKHLTDTGPDPRDLAPGRGGEGEGGA